MNKQAGKSSITQQLRIVFAVSIVILILSSYASYYTNRKLVEASQWVNHTNEVILNAENLLSTIKDAEAGHRGFMLTGDQAFLQRFNEDRDVAQKLVSKLKTLTIDNLLQQDNLKTVSKKVEERFTQMQRVLDMMGRTGAVEPEKVDVARNTEMTKGRLLMADVRTWLDAVENEERRLLKIRTDEQETYSKVTPIMVLLASVISILISVLAYFRIKSDLEERLKKQKEDEEKYIETNKRIGAVEQVTKRIAAGDLTARSADIATDDLGRISAALNDMVLSLEKNFTELERRNWLQAGAMAISDAVRGERYLKLMAAKIMNSITTYLNAPVATLYTADDEQNLYLQAAHAISNAPQHIKAGDGLLGEGLRSKTVTVSSSLPAAYMQVSSSIGHTATVYSVIVPLRLQDTTIGAIELGMLKKPGEEMIAYLQDNAEAIAIGLNAAINYEKIQELLEETQAQSEELQAQHNELENINTELEAQTEKLQASEEELRVQQEELHQANDELQERSRLLEERNHLISEKNIEVQKKAEQLALSTRYKSEFLANMSHELRTPLNSILLLSRLLSENTERTLNDNQVEYAQVIQSSGNSLLALIDEILDLSKIEAGKMELEYARTTVEEISEDMRTLFAPLAKDKKLKFSISTDGAVTEMETDKMRLEQVLKNLLSNAFKFTTQGSIELLIAKDAQKEGYVCFSVKDTGIGISEDKQLLIFEAFQQADGSTRRKFGGTGLGLSISKQLALLLGGDISIHSQVGRGSTFTISVPVTKQNAVPREPALPEAGIAEVSMHDVPPQRETDNYISDNIPKGIPDDREQITAKDNVILIVEDDVSFAKALLDFTRKEGYKGVTSVRGDEALPLARKYLPTGILLDIQLPIKSGWQVMEELKADPKTRHIPVHIMSSHSVKKESLMKGAINFINKPVAMDQLHEIFDKLQHVLDRTTKKVLIVDDNPKHAKALAYFLETFNINTDLKASISDSITALSTDTDCVILDMGIPDTNAYNALDEIKKNAGLEHLPIIVFTGKSLSMSEEQRIRQYADSIIVKTAHSYQRILDEVSLFLHIVEENTAKRDTNGFKKLGALNDVLKNKTVLVVDDDVRNIFSLTKALEGVNMKIITAIDGKEAIEKLQQHKEIDVVLLDMMMPRMDGYETAGKIRQNPKWKKLPVIAVTAKAMTGDRDKCIQAGASDYITKPVDVDQLLSLLRVWLYETNLSNNN